MGLKVLIYLSKYLNQETAKKSFRSSSEAVTCYYQSNHAKVEAILLSALPKDTTSKLADLYLHKIHFLCLTSSRKAVNQWCWQKNFQGGGNGKNKTEK